MSEAARRTDGAGSIGKPLPELLCFGGREPTRVRFVLSTWGLLGVKEGKRGQASDCSPGSPHRVEIVLWGEGSLASRKYGREPCSAGMPRSWSGFDPGKNSLSIRKSHSLGSLS